jgi:hypothetical protein
LACGVLLLPPLLLTPQVSLFKAFPCPKFTPEPIGWCATPGRWQGF